jgi:signal transduction histidine kinase
VPARSSRRPSRRPPSAQVAPDLSPGLAPVLDAVLGSAARHCAAADALLFRVDDGRLRLIAQHGALRPPVPLGEAIALQPRLFASRAVLERRTLHIRDVDAAARQFPDSMPLQRLSGVRTLLVMPVLHAEEALGALVVRRTRRRPFTSAHLARLRTFADQAAAALAAARAASDLEACRRELGVALERQAATGDILGIITRAWEDPRPVFDAILASAVALCGAEGGAVLRYDGELLHLETFTSTTPEADALYRSAYPRRPDRALAGGRAILDGAVVHVPDTDEDPSDLVRRVMRAFGARSMVVAPMLAGARALGAIVLSRAQPEAFTDGQIDLLRTFASEAAIAMENARLFGALQARNRELAEALARETAAADILRVISGSPAAVEPVMAAMVERAARLCGAQNAQIFRAEGPVMRLVARYGPVASSLAPGETRAVTRGSVSGRVMLDAAMLHIEDLASEVDAEYPDIAPAIHRQGIRTTVGVPLLRDGAAIGAITAFRTEVRPFTEAEIALLRTFADQAVIAIENARLFHELEARSRQLEVADRHKSEFLASMSHELRTPLNAIIGFSEVLGERMFGDLNDKQAEYVGDIQASGRHLLALINDILDLSKVEAGRMELEPSAFDLPEILASALALVRGRADAHGLALDLTVGPGVGTITADERKVRQILLNLLSNAVKFTPDGGRVALAATARAGTVEITVSDTGVGIAPEDLGAVFEEFRQVGTDRARKQEGTGLGLALARRLVELHGGTIGVTSTPGQGTTFTVTLPVAG